MELFSEAPYRPLLNRIRAKKRGETVVPYSPQFEVAPLHKLCRLALLLKEAHLEEEAAKLVSSLLRLEPFPSLWCPEKQFEEKNVRHWFSKIRSIIPKEQGLDLPCSFFEEDRLQAVFTSEGQKTSLGVIRINGVEIPSFGPQSDPFHFGIQGKGIQGWVPTAAYPEVWLQMKHQGALELSFRFVGITSQTPLFLAFYVKAKSCQVGTETLAPKSLRRFVGEAQRIHLESKCFIDTREPRKVEITPLAGTGCFWDADFLVAYPIGPFSAQFSLSLLAK